MPDSTFDPNAAHAPDSGIFGLPHGESESSLVYLPVPWELTASYGGGTADGPASILTASRQLDLYDVDVQRPYEAGLYMLPESADVRSWNTEGRAMARSVHEVGGRVAGDAELTRAADALNRLSRRVNDYVHSEARRLMRAGKIVGVVGGEHSVPFGAIQAAAEEHPSFGILHFDAHSDTRVAYEGFEHSHASIMYNVLERIPAVSKLVQVGIRDVCQQEIDYCRSRGDRVHVYFDAEHQRRRFEGLPWARTCGELADLLPPKVWVSFDIDGLDPRFCPHTGTPVPGGLDFAEALYLIGEVVRSGRTIIGFDVVEVAPSSDSSDEWDGNVGARLLYKLSAWTLASQGKAPLNRSHSASQPW